MKACLFEPRAVHDDWHDAHYEAAEDACTDRLLFTQTIKVDTKVSRKGAHSTAVASAAASIDPFLARNRKQLLHGLDAFGDSARMP